MWIGANCIIKQGIKIGDGCVIGANSFVNKDIPEFTIAFGTPAKVIKKRLSDDVIEKIKSIRWWDYNEKEAFKIIKDTLNLDSFD